MSGQHAIRGGSTIIGIILMALPVSAQVLPLTNTDITRLLAMHVSEQTVIAVIREAATTQFDLSAPALSALTGYGISTAVTAAMRQSATPSAVMLGAPSQQPGGQTLAGASALAAARDAANPQGWRPVIRIGDASVSEPAGVATTTPATTTTIKEKGYSKDETYWKDRMRDLTTKLNGDQTFLAAAVIRERALDTQLHRNRDDILYIYDRTQRGVVESQWQEAVTDVGRLKALVQNDTRAKADLELEAHRAGVPPGWLVLE